jgi:hypothetical protein
VGETFRAQAAKNIFFYSKEESFIYLKTTSSHIP